MANGQPKYAIHQKIFDLRTLSTTLDRPVCAHRFVVVFVSALLVYKSIAQTFQDSLIFLQAFTTVAYASQPDAFWCGFLDYASRGSSAPGGELGSWHPDD